MNRQTLLLVFLLLWMPFSWAADAPTSMDQAVADINEMMSAAWKNDSVTPADKSSDAEFCRRVWLDLAGVAPPISEIRSFLKDTSVDKRSKLIDRLLVSPYHATHMAATWNDILLPADAQSNQQRSNVAKLESWLRDQFIDNTPYDYFVGGFLKTTEQGPAIFYTTRDVEPKKIAAATSKIFLGIQLQCAECHDHPFDRWTQEDFWSYAAFFAQLQQSDQQMNGGVIEISDASVGEVTLPDTEDIVAPRYPGATEPPEEDVTNNRRRQLTIWLASRDNQYFVRAAVNRTWAHLFGRGLVDPIDAMNKDNVPSHPEVLDYLTQYFVQHRFNMRTLMATLARTEAYQLSSALDGDRPEQETFAVMNVKTLTARQFYDSTRQNVLRRSPDTGANGVDLQREQFLSRMRATDTTPRDYPHGVMQALGVMNGPEVIRATGDSQSGLLAALQAPIFSETDRLESVFLAALSRMPSERESERIVKYPSKSKSESERAEWFSDVLWTLLNTAEATVCP